MSAAATQPTFTLITGGNSGIGLELARQAAADGRNLILVAQNPAALEAAAAELNRNVKVHTISHDLSQPGAAEAVYDSVRQLGADVDCLINNAGFGDHGPFATSDLARQRSMIAVNITALTELTRLFLPAMLQRGRGQILNVASVTAFVPGPLMSVYFATKHYVLAFSEALIEELRGSGVTVTAVCPPPVRTPFVSAAQIVSANYMATTKITPAEVARYGYQMMKRGKPVAVYSLRWRFVTSFLVRITPRFGSASTARPHEPPGRRFTSACRTRRRLTVKETFMSETIQTPAAAESRMVSAPGGLLHVRDFPGAEPALVALHGFPDDSRIYDRLAPLLAPRRVVAVDWLGYGRSDRVEPGSLDGGRHQERAPRCARLARAGPGGVGGSRRVGP